METILIDRFRSVHQHERVTLTAELSSRPTREWARACESNLARYGEGFGELPLLVEASIVVGTTPQGLASSQMALRAVVAATNERLADELVESR